MESSHGFFASRKHLDFGVCGDDDSKFMQYRNIPVPIAYVISAKMATLHELSTVYGVEDMYNLLEVISIDAYNARIARGT